MTLLKDLRLAAASFLICLPILVPGAKGRSSSDSKSVKVYIRNLAGESVGTATLKETQPRGIELLLDLKNMPPGKHNFHIHQKGLCNADSGFDSAGLQYDPTGDFYGNAGKGVHHGQAAGNPGAVVDIADDGTGHATAVFTNLTLGNGRNSVLAEGGTAIIFHAVPGADGPTRIACGVIQDTQ